MTWTAHFLDYCYTCRNAFNFKMLRHNSWKPQN